MLIKVVKYDFLAAAFGKRFMSENTFIVGQFPLLPQNIFFQPVSPFAIAFDFADLSIFSTSYRQTCPAARTESLFSLFIKNYRHRCVGLRETSSSRS